MQQEITRASSLLEPDGRLTQIGWSRQPLLDCNLEAARFYRLRGLQWSRIKRWDYYGLTTPEFYFSATLAHLGYAGTVFVYVIDLASGAMCEETLLVPLGRGIVLPRNSESGESTFASKTARLHFWVENGTRRVQVAWPRFNRGEGLEADLSMAPAAAHESMNIVIPIPPGRFYFNRKVNCIPASGWVRRGGRTTAIEPSTCLGNLDWGRGVWDYSSFWVWASASGFLPGGRTLGLNLGYGFGETSLATENALILDGRIHKLDQVRFDYNSQDFMRPWHLSAPDGRLDLEFVPFKERVARSDVLFIHSEVHQMFGRYSGQVVADNGERIRVQNLIGFAEEHHAKW
jgi:Domain of unknown function (DUF2804), N-terminal/Domain of unknown function (DUF2804), C-terminal